MKVTINEKNENKLLGRKEVSGTISFEGVTPSNKQLTESLAKEFKVDMALVVVKKIHNKFSLQEASFLAFVYDTKEALVKAEMVTKHIKKKIEEEKKKAEAERKKAEEEKKKAAEEAPKEETKEGEQ